MIALAIAVIALWTVAGFLYFADGTSTRLTIDTALATSDEPITMQEHQQRAA